MKSLVFGVHPIKYPSEKPKSKAPFPKEAAKKWNKVRTGGKKPSGGGAGSKKTPDLAQVAIWNEYGTKNAPPRPAFRMGLEEGINKNRKLIQAQLQNIARRVLTGRASEAERSMVVMLTQIGKSAKAETQRIIREGLTAPNAESTIAKKGYDWPLHETGLLEKNVDYEVRE